MGKNSREHQRSLISQFRRMALLATIPFVLLTVASNLTTYLLSRRTLDEQIVSRSIAIHDTIRVQVDNSIRAYLRSKTEMAVDILKAAEGDPVRINDALAYISTVTVGDSGYIYAIDVTGTMVFHPDSNLVGGNYAEETPGSEQLELRYGYLEYNWQNTYETSLQAKAMFMQEMQNPNWIVTATSYRREFARMVDIESIKRIINRSHFGSSGYSYVIDRSGEYIAHPRYAETSEATDIVGLELHQEFVRRLFEQQEGFVTYEWKDSAGGATQEKTVYVKYLPDFDWVIGTAAYQSDNSQPYFYLSILAVVIAAAVTAYLSYFILRMNRGVSLQVNRITTVLDEGRLGNLSQRIEEEGPSELKLLSVQVNFFLNALDTKTRELEELNSTLEDRVEERTAELGLAAAKLVESEKKIITSRLIAGVAHEINNPLGVALTAISLAQEKIDEHESLRQDDTWTAILQDIREGVDIAFRNMKRAKDLVRSFKSVSTDQLTLSRRKFSLQAVVDDIVISLSPLLKKQQVVLQKDIIAVELDGFPGVFSHILTNFIQNSMIHGFAEGQGGRINISAVRQGDNIVLTYRDNGNGIDPQVADTLFDPFITTRRHAGSIGLGLNIVRNLIEEKLNGSIMVNSEPDWATVFTIEFPAG